MSSYEVFIKILSAQHLKGLHSEFKINSSVKYLECGYSGSAQPYSLTIIQTGDRVDILREDIIYEV